MVAAALALGALPQRASAEFVAIRYRDRGLAVLLLQQRLVELGYLGRSGADGVFGDQTWHAVVAFQGWQRIRRDGVVGPTTLGALARAQRPHPWVRMARALEVDLGRQVLLVVRGGVAQRALHASTGAPQFATPVGRFVVVRRVQRSWSRLYHVWLPYALYFDRGWAIHGYARVPDRPSSHGCIRLSLHDARLVFQETEVGMPVIVRGVPSRALPVPARREETARSRRQRPPAKNAHHR